MSKSVDTKPRAQRIDSQDEAVASSVEVTERREAAAQDQASRRRPSRGPPATAC